MGDLYLNLGSVSRNIPEPLLGSGGLETVVGEVWKLLLTSVLALGQVVGQLLRPGLAQFLETEI